MKVSVLQQNRIVYSNYMQGTLLSISSNGLGNKSYFMPVCSIVKLLPLSTVVELMHNCTRIVKLFGRVQLCTGLTTVLRGNSFDYTTNRDEITV